MQIKRKGMLLVLSGPSGAGKGTLAHRLLREDPSFHFSVSVTTRPPRYNEIDGVHYQFITKKAFDALVEEDAFLEYATVHGNHYGTLRASIEKRMELGENILLDIDTQGAKTVLSKATDCVSVFIIPPSYEALRIRLHTRNTDDPVEIERRLNNAKAEIQQLSRYQYAIINDDIELAYSHLLNIVNAEKLRTTRFFPNIDI